MATITIEDPDEVMTKAIQQNGSVYIGRKYAGKTVRVVVEVVDKD